MKTFYIEEFFNNPAGKGSTAMNISATKAQFNQRYQGAISGMSLEIYNVDDKALYYHVKLPSSVAGISYDIVAKFDMSSDTSTIKQAPMTVFSNSPSFLYTFAYAYQKQGLFAKEFKSKISSETYKKIAETKNPSALLSYDFSIYAGLAHILRSQKLTTNSEGVKKVSLKHVITVVKNADAIKDARHEQKTINKQAEENKKKDKLTDFSNEHSGENYTPISNVASVNKHKKIKETSVPKNTVRKMKKVKRK